MRYPNVDALHVGAARTARPSHDTPRARPASELCRADPSGQGIGAVACRQTCRSTGGGNSFIIHNVIFLSRDIPYTSYRGQGSVRGGPLPLGGLTPPHPGRGQRLRKETAAGKATALGREECGSVHGGLTIISTTYIAQFHLKSTKHDYMCQTQKAF